ncbi:MAG: glutamine-hydrolyzing GMP synthase [Candidatus Thermoplasmatota archaeon]|nr:glutamine-hydrolyzing GMP synthase [Candidatus Thermoplasmatota archaeon]
MNEILEKTREEIGNKKVIAAVSGGGDSTLAAHIAIEAGAEVFAVFVDSGLLREGEAERTEKHYSEIFRDHFVLVDAGKEFFEALKGVTDPEEKRKRIGKKFVEIFERIAKEKGAEVLVQGTIAPDWIESGGQGRDRIKSHHNVGGMPETFLKVVEPLRDLYKDEVRELLKQFGPGLDEKQPFPGPGLAVRVLGEVTEEKTRIVRKANAIVEEVLDRSKKPWQYFAVLLPVKSTGVKGDERVYGVTIAIRAVDSTDGMSGSFSRIPYDLLEEMSSRITREIPECNRVVYDITNKPPATIEWE